MRVAVGDVGILTRDLPTTCCKSIIHAGVPIFIKQQTSPKRVMVAVPVDSTCVEGVWFPFASPGHWFWWAGMQKDGGLPTGEEKPHFYALHKVKASKIWLFEDLDYEAATPEAQWIALLTADEVLARQVGHP